MSRFTALTLAALLGAAAGPGTAPLDAQEPPAEPTASTQDEEPEAEATRRRPRRRPRVDSSNTGYIDNAIIGTRFSLRADAASGNDNPDRAEFFYAKCGCFRNEALRDVLGAAFDPTSPGPGNLPEADVDYEELEIAYEHAFSEGRFSVFAELPIRSIDLNDNMASSSGLADLRVGAKVAIVASADRYLTFQVRAYLPTGEPRDGLGTDHSSLEPGLLLFQQLTDRLTLGAELKYWYPHSGSSAVGLSDDPSDEFSGDILRYGVGLAYDFTASSGLQLAPVAEVVGWSVLDGFKTAGSADGDTIVNLKLGTRIRGGFPGSFYVGYGFALTDDVWYDGIFRVEYRVSR